MDVLTVFAKHPRPGHSKSRLAATLGEEQAFSIANALLSDTLETVNSFLAHARPKQTASISYTPNDEAVHRRFAEVSSKIDCEPQIGDSLGDRLAICFENWFARGAENIIVIGTDCPTINADDLSNAFRLLENADVVLGPATDGGYYLVGLSSPQPRLFDDVDWSTADVLTQTASRIREQQLTLNLLPTKSDLDIREDLSPVFGQLEARRTAKLPGGEATYEILRELREQEPAIPSPLETASLPRFEVLHFDEIDPVDCPCGHARRAFSSAADFPATVHQTEITLDAKPHFHERQSEVYVVLDCNPGAILELDGERVPVRVGSTALIRPGCIHRAIGRMKVMIICSPKFDPQDEFVILKASP